MKLYLGFQFFFLLVVTIQSGSCCALHEEENGRGGRHTGVKPNENNAMSLLAGSVSPSPGAKNLEDISANMKTRLASLDPASVSSGVIKYLVLPDQERDMLTLYTAPEEEIGQYERDLEKINAAVYSDYETYKLYSDLSEFVDDSWFMAQDQGQTQNSGRYWSLEKRMDVIRQLDAKFGNEPAWARYWNYKFDKTLEFMEKYG